MNGFPRILVPEARWVEPEPSPPQPHKAQPALTALALAIAIVVSVGIIVALTVGSDAGSMVFIAARS